LSPDDESVSVTFRLPSKQYDVIQKKADMARITLGEWLRNVVAVSVKSPKKS